jgi:RNA 2',3'-cyclic 3'-phosphodiesterase
MQRLFFALWPDDNVRTRIEVVTAKLPSPAGRRVPRENLHITLLFMGSVEESARLCAESVADQLDGHPFDLRLDQLGFWPRPQVIWLSASSVPKDLVELVDRLHQGVAQCGLILDDRPFQPHMTLMRKVTKAGPMRAIEPIEWRVEHFALVESLTHSSGAIYQVLKSWNLG